MKVINLTRVTQHPDVLVVDAGVTRKDQIQIVGQGRVELRTGMTIATRWLETHPNVLKISEGEK